jgi:hypothetical protein
MMIGVLAPMRLNQVQIFDRGAHHHGLQAFEPAETCKSGIHLGLASSSNHPPSTGHHTCSPKVANVESGDQLRVPPEQEAHSSYW